MAYTPTSAGGGSASGGNTFADPFSGGGLSSIFQVPVAPSASVTQALGLNADGGSQTPGGVPYLPTSPASSTSSSQALMMNLYRMTPNEIADLQSQLRLSGYAPSTLRSTGILDSATLNGYHILLGETAHYAEANPDNPPYTPDTLLATRVAAYNAANGAASKGTVAELSDPLVAQKIVQNALRSHLGRNPTPDEQSTLAASLSAYNQQPNATVSGGQALADNYATGGTQALANEAGGQSQVGFVNVLEKLMRGAP